MAFVAQMSPYFSANVGIVPIVPSPSTNSPTSPCGFQGLQRFHGKQGTIMECHEQNQNITCHMGKRSIALFVLFPTSVKLSAMIRKLCFDPRVFSLIRWKVFLLLLQPPDTGFQLVNLAAGSSLPSIKTLGIKVKWFANLLIVNIHSSCAEKRAHSPQSAPSTRSTLSHATL